MNFKCEWTCILLRCFVLSCRLYCNTNAWRCSIVQVCSIDSHNQCAWSLVALVCIFGEEWFCDFSWVSGLLDSMDCFQVGNQWKYLLYAAAARLPHLEGMRMEARTIFTTLLQSNVVCGSRNKSRAKAKIVLQTKRHWLWFVNDPTNSE